MLMNGIMMDLHIKPMKKQEYIVPAIQIIATSQEGLLCMSSFNQNMFSIDDVDEGVDYGIL